MFPRIVSVLLLVFTLSGCSTTFIYNNLDWLIPWYLDDYIELNKPQKADFKPALRSWLAWHKQTQLPLYEADFIQLKQQFEQGSLNEQQWLTVFANGRKRYQSVRDYLVPRLMPFAQTLTEPQVKQLFNTLAEERQDEYQEFSELDAQARLERRQKQLQANVKEWVGKLSKTQKATIARYAEQFASTYSEWMAYQDDVQGVARQLFTLRGEPEVFARQLSGLMLEPEVYRSEAYQQAAEQNRLLYAQLYAELLPGLSNKQRKRVLRKFDQWIEDLHDLQQD